MRYWKSKKLDKKSKDLRQIYKLKKQKPKRNNEGLYTYRDSLNTLNINLSNDD